MINLEQKELSKRLYMSKVCCFQQCPKKYEWVHHYHLQPKSRPSYFAFGSEFHHAVLDNGLIKGQDHSDLYISQNTNITEDDQSLMLKMSDQFFVKWNEYPKQLLGVEKSVETEVDSKFFSTWVVKADMIFKDEEGVWVGDLKTTSGYGASTARYYHSSPQTKTYFHQLSKVMTSLIGTKIFVVTKQKVRCEEEPILINENDHYQAKMFIDEAVSALDNAESSQNFPRCMSSCINSFGQECPYIPICIQKIKSEAYLNDMVSNWFEISHPDAHLELGE